MNTPILALTALLFSNGSIAAEPFERSFESTLGAIASTLTGGGETRHQVDVRGENDKNCLLEFKAKMIGTEFLGRVRASYPNDALAGEAYLVQSAGLGDRIDAMVKKIDAIKKIQDTQTASKALRALKPELRVLKSDLWFYTNVPQYASGGHDADPKQQAAMRVWMTALAETGDFEKARSSLKAAK